MSTRSGELRETLIEAISAIRARKIDPEEGKAIAALAREVSLSLQTEINARREEKATGTDRVALIGELILGEQQEKP